MSAASPSILVTKRPVETANRTQLLGFLEQTVETRNEWIRRMVLKHNRIDILAEYVLGYTVVPNIHFKIMKHQFQFRDGNLILVYRGAGKTTVGTITKCIHYILKNRDVKILIGSKTAQNASDFLKEIKQHFESNERLREIFGDFVGDNRWDNTCIEVSGRSRPMKEPTIMTVGIEGAVASKHYHVIIADDLVDEENSRTLTQRQKIIDWYYKMLSPCLLPPDPKNPDQGNMHHLGTRFHYEDLYGHLTEVGPDGSGGQLKKKTLVIPAIGADGSSPWPERHPPEWFEEKRRNFGIIRFNSQYQCDTEAMKGQIFRYDDCQVLPDSKWPRELLNFNGTDLAIGEKEQNDMFADVVIGRDKSGGIYVQDFFEGQRRFHEQTKIIVEMYNKWKCTRGAIEANAYQAAQWHELRRLHPDVNIRPVITMKDKVSRAHQLTSRFETKKVFFKEGQHHLIEHLVLFPGHRYKDLFDAFDLAILASEVRMKKQRKVEPGLL